jgi:DNA repair protein RecN (Recombination protein N)
LKQASLFAEEAAASLRDYMDRLEGDPERLEYVETRLAALERLKRKYGQTLEEVVAFQRDIVERIDQVENASEHKANLEREREKLAAEFKDLARQLTAERTKAADQLSNKVDAELKRLAMPGTRFEIAVRPTSWSATGIDDIVFLVSPNRGEDLKPLAQIASGGELSRIALALKTAIGDRHQTNGFYTLVFDEVDAGVGGAAAAAVGRRLKLLSRHNQVIRVTHLAQIAGFADHHYAVSKREKKRRTSTEIVELALQERAREIGRMLSGEHITPEALKQAEQLIQAGSIA